MISIILMAIGAALFCAYCSGIVVDGFILIAACILIVGGAIKAEITTLVNIIADIMYMEEEVLDVIGNEYNPWQCDNTDGIDDHVDEEGK